MAWTGSDKFRLVLSVVLAGYLVLNVMQGDWVWVALIAGVLALNAWSLTANLRAPSAETTAPPETPPDDEH